MSNKPARPLLVVVAAPSGAGKSTLCDRLLSERPDMAYSVSCTTRAPRGREQDGVDYHFLSRAEFDQRVARGEFLEHALVHGHAYGTLRRTVTEALAAGRGIIMDIDVQGARQIRALLPALPAADPIRRGYTDIFILPPSREELRRRLVGRGEDTTAAIERRLANADGELAAASEFRHRIVNDDLEQAYAELKAILEREART